MPLKIHFRFLNEELLGFIHIKFGCSIICGLCSTIETLGKSAFFNHLFFTIMTVDSELQSQNSSKSIHLKGNLFLFQSSYSYMFLSFSVKLPCAKIWPPKKGGRNYPTPWGNLAHTFVFKLRANHEELEVQIFMDDRPPLDLLNPLWVGANTSSSFFGTLLNGKKRAKLPRMTVVISLYIKNNNFP